MTDGQKNTSCSRLTTNDLFVDLVKATVSSITFERFHSLMGQLVRPLSQSGCALIRSGIRSTSAVQSTAVEKAVSFLPKDQTIDENPVELWIQFIPAGESRGQVEPACITISMWERSWALSLSALEPVRKYLEKSGVMSEKCYDRGSVLVYSPEDGEKISKALQTWREPCTMFNAHLLPWVKRLPCGTPPCSSVVVKRIAEAETDWSGKHKTWTDKLQAGSKIQFHDSGQTLPVSWTSFEVAKKWFEVPSDIPCTVDVHTLEPPYTQPSANQQPEWIVVINVVFPFVV